MIEFLERLAPFSYVAGAMLLALGLLLLNVWTAWMLRRALLGER